MSALMTFVVVAKHCLNIFSKFNRDSLATLKDYRLEVRVSTQTPHFTLTGMWH
ncbi:hypothetical protein BMS3Abin14_02072 [bacterium BMS3Abin14]|nr:hypothetical protein BMS3Abin14_02072 [bacterium BMS3Abin14]